MDPQSQGAWKQEALETVFAALAHNRTLVSRLIFKGARVLNRRLNDASRQSLDLDAGLRAEFLEQYPDPAERVRVLQQEIEASVSGFLASKDSTLYTLESVTVEQKPTQGNHPFGWNGMTARLRLRDVRLAQTVGLPTIELDFSAPESFGPHAIAPLNIDGVDVDAESIGRIAAEKLRAFLQSLPAWRTKTGSQTRAVRVRDVFDLRRIVTVKSLSDSEFWDEVGAEFGVACESRSVDCAGLTTFAEQLDVTRATFENDATVPKTWPFDELWQNLTRIVEHLERSGVVPFSFPPPSR
jgi:Nucleotidyl transferase AbiEii toxin, Type IV TA system